MLALMKRLWKGWKRFASAIVNAQNTVLLFVVFLFGIGPVALVARLRRRHFLDLTPPPPPGLETGGTWWTPLPQRTMDVKSAQRPF